MLAGADPSAAVAALTACSIGFQSDTTILHLPQDRRDGGAKVGCRGLRHGGQVNGDVALLVPVAPGAVARSLDGDAAGPSGRAWS